MSKPFTPTPVKAPVWSACPAPAVATTPPPVAVPKRPPARGLFGIDGLAPRAEPQRGQACQAARSTLDATDAAILGGKSPAPAVATDRAWNKTSDPLRWSRVATRYGLGKAERAQLGAHGFALTNVEHASYIDAYHDIFQSQLPIYVSIDSVLHAIFASHEGVANDLERSAMAPRVTKLLDAMHCWLPAHGADLTAETAHDLDVYLGVARTLGSTNRYLYGDAKKTFPVHSLAGNEEEIRALVTQILEGKGIVDVELFGRERALDTSLFIPRGRYSGGTTGYFEVMTWLSRIELNLVSRGSRSSVRQVDRAETPRDVALALALVATARGAGVDGEIAALDGIWGELAGKREDVSFAQLAELRDRARVSAIGDGVAAQAALARAIGGGWQRTIPFAVTPDRVTDLPVIAAMFGQRVVPDASALSPIIQPQVPDRVMVGGADLAFLLGHDRAKAHLAGELAKFPALATQLPAGRAVLDGKLASAGTDLYALWLRAIRAHAAKPVGATPSFMAGDGYADLKLASTVAAFGQLRHAYVLVAGNSYLGSGCEIPDGWVEPAAEVYDALIAYAERGAALTAKYDPANASDATYWKRLHTTLRVLRAIVAQELAGKPLTDVQKKWLSMVVEIVVDNSGSGAPPTYAGWYFDLFRDFGDATMSPRFLSDYAANDVAATYLGVRDLALGAFVIDVGGAPRIAVGPIARPFELRSPTDQGRLDDSAIGELDPALLRAPWHAAFAVPKIAAPKDVAIDMTWDYDEATEQRGATTIIVKARRVVGDVTIELLDHHNVGIAKQTKKVGVGETKFVFAAKVAGKMENVHAVIGPWHGWGGFSGDGGFYMPGLEAAYDFEGEGEGEGEGAGAGEE